MYYIDPATSIFPHPSHADADGLLCIGGNLKPKTLKAAYSFGIFPWYNEGFPIMWWSPDPRLVLYPNELKIAKSMRSYFNQKKYEVSYNHNFTEVMLACKNAQRKNQSGTWITKDMIKSYTKLHKKGIAHSVEVWAGKELVGGLYGISLGKVFFGESMFSLATNASKFGFISLVKKLEKEEVMLIDCQQETNHLKSLGARSISRKKFMDALSINRQNFMK